MRIVNFFFRIEGTYISRQMRNMLGARLGGLF